MSDIFENIKQSAGQVLSNIDQKGQLKSALDGLRSQWNELERRRKTSSLDKEIKTQQGEMKQLTEALGLQTWSLFDSGKIVHPELARLCERISEVRAEIDAKKAELEALKAQVAAQQAAQAAAAQQAAAQQAAAQQAAQAAAAQQAAAQQAAAQQAAAQQAAAQAPAAQTPAAGTPAAGAAGQRRTVVRLRCPRCKTELSAGDDFCPTCGVKLVHPAPQPAPRPRPVAQAQPPSPTAAQPQPVQPSTASGVRFCPSCGAETKPDAQFCPICGQTLH